MSARLRIAAMALLVAVALAAPAAPAYTPSESQWNPASVPISYVINLSSAPATIGMDGARSAVTNGFASWEAPACTAWRSTNAGTSTLTRARAGDSQRTILWISDSWPPELGDVNSTIGVTTPVWRTGGYFIDADIQFNAVGFRWSMTGSGGTVDTQSIAVHEEGHFLGLDHSTLSRAIMYASYSGGIKRTLDADDVNGVCYLYPSGTMSGCTSDAQCSGGQRCISGRCQFPPDSGTSGEGRLGDPCSATMGCAAPGFCACRSSTDCICVQNCSASSPCPTGFSCVTTTIGGVCLRSSGGTMMGTGGTGEPCSSGNDCASGICVNGGGSTFCSRVCTDDCTCPGTYHCVPTTTPGTSVCAPGANRCEPDTDAGPIEQPDAAIEDANSDAQATDDVQGDARQRDRGPETQQPGCGCHIPSSESRATPALLAFAALAVLAARRRRR